MIQDKAIAVRVEVPGRKKDQLERVYWKCSSCLAVLPTGKGNYCIWCGVKFEH